MIFHELSNIGSMVFLDLFSVRLKEILLQIHLQVFLVFITWHFPEWLRKTRELIKSKTAYFDRPKSEDVMRGGGSLKVKIKDVAWRCFANTYGVLCYTKSMHFLFELYLHVLKNQGVFFVLKRIPPPSPLHPWIYKTFSIVMIGALSASK